MQEFYCDKTTHTLVHSHSKVSVYPNERCVVHTVYNKQNVEHLPVEPKSEKEDEVGEAMLPPLGSIELTIAWWLVR